MPDRGITFSAPMVRALLEGRKTQTRRLITKKPALDALTIFKPSFLMLPGNADLLPHAPGDRLYVREHWKTTPAYDDLAPSGMGGDEPLLYLADGATFNWGEADGVLAGRHRQAMHMPRWASRLWLRVTDVRVQRLQEISVADCIAEGIDAAAIKHFGGTVKAYGALWDSIHGGESDNSWAADPWIYAVTFDVKIGNIDQPTQ